MLNIFEQIFFYWSQKIYLLRNTLQLQKPFLEPDSELDIYISIHQNFTPLFFTRFFYINWCEKWCEINKKNIKRVLFEIVSKNPIYYQKFLILKTSWFFKTSSILSSRSKNAVKGGKNVCVVFFNGARDFERDVSFSSLPN